jgi:hypothetical protein
MLQLTRSSFVCTETYDSLSSMRRTFDEQHALRLPRFLDSDLLAYVHQSIRAANFYERDHEDIAREACMHDNPMLAMMCLIMNDGRLFEVIRCITGCAPIGYFNGRIYAFAADANHFDQWHSDTIDDRRIGISINLTEGQFEGGVFELRHADAEATHWSIANTGSADAILFRIGDDLLHRVTPVIGPVPRVAYAGWFQGRGDLLSLLKKTGGANEYAVESLQYTDPAATT